MRAQCVCVCLVCMDFIFSMYFVCVQCLLGCNFSVVKCVCNLQYLQDSGADFLLRILEFRSLCACVCVYVCMRVQD